MNTPEINKSDEPDYPAAHSMDTDWFAVDKDGHVAMFSSQEDGPVPITAPQDGGGDVLERIATITGRTLETGQWEMPEPASIGVFNYQALLGEAPANAGIGPEDYDEDNMAILPYKLISRPDNILNIADLPADLQAELSTYRLADVSFAESAWVQPALHTPCQFWSMGDWSTLRIIDADGTTKSLPEHLCRQDHFAESPDKSATPPKSPDGDNRPWWKKIFDRDP